MVRLSKTPERQKRGPPGRRYIPDRPPGGYVITGHEPVDSHLASLDHEAEIRRAIANIERADELMSKLETRIDKITAKLTDPALLDEIPHDDPRRIEAEDLRDELTEKHLWQGWAVRLAAGDIATHATYTSSDNKDLRHIDVDPEVIARVRVECPEVLTHRGWRALLASDCPF